VRDGRIESVAASEIALGEELWIVPGDLVPVDGIVLGEPARVSLDWIDGESRPRRVEVGGTVRAGSFNADATPLRIGAAQDFAASRLVDLLANDPETSEQTSGRWWHRVSTIYVAAVLLFAVAAFVVWAPAGLERALAVTVSVLVVTCPCALGLATPLAHEMVLVSLRRRGIFVRRGTFTDRALSVRKILFDKTGTLTMGRITLTDAAKERIRALHPESAAVLASLAACSNHPVSCAIARALPAPAVTGAGSPPREIPGSGLEWERAGGTWRLGSRPFAAPESHGQEGATPPDAVPEAILSRNGEEITALAYAEELRDDAREEIDALHAADYEVHLLSGDTGDRVQAAAEALGIRPERVAGSLSPEAKAALVTALDQQDTLMVGDGLNDGPSFRAAWTAATPAIDHATLPGRADFYFLGGGIGAIRSALVHARRLRTVVRDNLVLATFYNVAALALCFAGVVTPVVAAVLMPLSSAGVVSLTATRLSKVSVPWK
jgi:Cu2+-exporting ATPase